MKRILVTGAGGQLGTELVLALREQFGPDAVLATDLREPEFWARGDGPTASLDCLDLDSLRASVEGHGTTTVYHLAAILSAAGEARPDLAYNVNLGGLMNVLRVAVDHPMQVFVPSSIAVFGPSSPKDPAPQNTIQRPTSMYGITKLAGELLSDFYHRRFGVDTRGLRYPGLISHSSPPGGGTTDYAVEIFHAAIATGRYTCFLGPDTRMDMMYMPDAVNAALSLMESPGQPLRHRNAYNVTAMQFTPAEIAEEIRNHIPDFEITYEPDPVRQAIADSWPDRLDDSVAREEWGWKPAYDLSTMVTEMLTSIRTTARA